jgi:SMC interacting uncharacterized protein involved in chromosome segregation
MSKEEEVDRLKQQLNELKHQLDDYRVALESYETGSSTLSEKQKIVYEMFRAFVGDNT